MLSSFIFKLFTILLKIIILKERYPQKAGEFLTKMIFLDKINDSNISLICGYIRSGAAPWLISPTVAVIELLVDDFNARIV